MAKEKAQQVLNKVSAKAKNLKIKETLEKIARGMPKELQKRVGSALILIPAVLFFIYTSYSLFLL